MTKKILFLSIFVMMFGFVATGMSAIFGINAVGSNSSDGTNLNNIAIVENYSDIVSNSRTRADVENEHTLITLDANGGHGGSGSVKATFGEAMPGGLDIPERAGYEFWGYYDTSDYYETREGNQYYKANMTSAMPWDKDVEETRLYAVWAPYQYWMWLDHNDGSGTVEPGRYATFDAELPSGIKAPTRFGFAFDGYYDTKDIGGKMYYNAAMEGQGTWDKPINTTLYARWSVSTYVITLDSNGGYTESQTVYVQNGQPMPKANHPDRDGYSFGGYYDTKTAPGGVEYYTENMVSKRNFDKGADTTLYARWTKIGYYITFDPNFDGGVAMPRVLAYFDDAMPEFEKTDAPVRLGYDFLGYWLDDQKNPDDSKQYYDENMNGLSVWDVPASTTLTAHWKEKDTESKVYTITFDKNGGIGGSSTVIVQDGQFVYGVTAPSKDGYIFIGYYDTLDGDDSDNPYFETVQDSEFLVSMRPWTIESDGTLYARWEKEPDLGGGGNGGNGNGNTNNQSQPENNTNKIIIILSVAVGGILIISGVVVWFKVKGGRKF